MGEILNSIESVGIRLDPETEITNSNHRSIMSFWRKVGEDQGYVYFERVKIEMQDLFRDHPERSGESVRVNVISEILRRKGYSSTLQPLECILVGYGSGDLSYTCSETTCIKAVLNSIRR